TGQRRKLASCHSFPFSCPAGLAWSPDGTLIAAAVENRVETISPSSGQVTRLATFGGAVSDVSWSPDGRRLAVVAEPRSHGRRQSLYILNGDGAKLARLDSGQLPPTRYFLEVLRMPALASPTWAPDGRSIAYIKIDTCDGRCLGDYESGFPGPRV